MTSTDFWVDFGAHYVPIPASRACMPHEAQQFRVLPCARSPSCMYACMPHEAGQFRMLPCVISTGCIYDD